MYITICVLQYNTAKNKKKKNLLFPQKDIFLEKIY